MASQAAATVMLDSVVIKILHAHSFARTSSQATSIISNLLSRYLVLVASACGQYAELAGRSKLSVHDLIACLGELGTNPDELSEYISTEGVELSRYASSSAKRLDDLADMRGFLTEGVAHEEDEVKRDGGAVQAEAVDYQPQSPSPTLALHPVKMERPPSPLPQHIASVTAGEYITQVPYSDSVLASTPQWHLPSKPNHMRTPKSQSLRFPTPSTQPALLAAYHHILTHPVSQPVPPNPAKHKVAMALISQIQHNTRWDAPSTLYAGIVPCPPRVVPIGPSHPIAHATLEHIRAGKDVEKDLEKRPLLPPAPPRPVFSNDKPVFLASHQSSRLPELARQVLPGSVLSRTSRLTHPPVLQRGSQKLYFGPGVAAPWNSSLTGGSGTHGGKGGEDSRMINGREAPSFTLPEAQMFATWDYEVKHFQEPLAAGRRSKMSATPMLSLSLGRPSKGAS
ncbi:hypothetical protein PAXRUDRAFT_833185 [Paxillus rubicundulus Ve08.2h10]|uniref:Bromodomain associated domain-containing protein n=1 Tax=Paxillus rubicundulus Ve08.2h10 TaxID=930991 RepID=A0A0D0DHP7_9AGAM|nr:hypothetical protein PAXRUDRAFT_833185 [Paxillus rubicundulus Ve08.2h10]